MRAKSSEELDSGGLSDIEDSPVVRTEESREERTPRSKARTPNFSRRAFASVERKLDKVKYLLTPGRRPRPDTPAKLRRTKVCTLSGSTNCVLYLPENVIGPAMIHMKFLENGL